MLPELAEYVTTCRKHFGPVNAVWSNFSGSDSWPSESASRSDWFVVKGNTDMVLRYIAQANNKGLMTQVERIDELYGLNQRPRLTISKKSLQLAMNSSSQIERPIPEWRCCRVFVSSTFRDMHAERDLICGLLFPSIRQYAARELRVHVNEVDLRWGVPESVTRTPKALQMCLEQAINADMFILLIGDRYGWVPRASTVRGLPSPILSRLNKFYEPGMSVTEMEYRFMKQSIASKVAPHLKRFGGKERDSISRRMFAFLRDPVALNNVPPAYLSEFDEQKPRKRDRLQHFKDLVRSDGVVVLDGYPAFFNGIVAGRPVMGNLTVLAENIYRCLRRALFEMYSTSAVTSLRNQSIALPLRPTHDAFMHYFVEPVASAIAPRQLLELERAFLELDARGKQCRTVRQFAQQSISSQTPATSRLSNIGHDGAVLLLTGTTGCGKTTHLAALASSLFKPGWSPLENRGDETRMSSEPRGTVFTRPTVVSDSSMAFQRPKLQQSTVFLHFVQGLPLIGLPPKTSLVSMLGEWINKMVAVVDSTDSFPKNSLERLKLATSGGMLSSETLNTSTDELLRQRMSCFTELLKLFSCFVDVQFVFMIDECDKLKPTVFDWIPNVLPQNVRFVVSCDAASHVAREFASRPDCLALTISGLSCAERAAAIRSLFGRYGKVLNETTFNNQVSLLVNKRNAELPLYLRLACDELRLHATYEELDSQIKELPNTIPTLIQHIISRTEVQCGSQLTRTALGLICCSRQPLSGPELHALLDLSMSISGPVQSFDACGWLGLDDGSFSVDDQSSVADSEHFIHSVLTTAAALVDPSGPRRTHLPSLAFQILVNNLRPLLAGLGDETEVDEEELDTSHDASLNFATEFRFLRFRSQEIESIVNDIAFRRTTVLSAISTVGYHPISSTGRHISKIGRTEQLSACGNCLSREDIHWILATTRNNLEHTVYHLFQAGKMKIICRLLTSGVFLMYKYRAGFGSSVSSDFGGYGLNDNDLQAQWHDVSQSNQFKDRLSSIKRFVSTHSSMLNKYPLMFPQLALNYPLDKWIRQIGFVLADLFQADLERQHLRTLICCSPEFGHCSTIFPEAICDLQESTVTRSPAPTAVAVDPSGRLLACGTDCGNVIIMETSTFRELRTLFGLGSTVLSCCFISIGRVESTNFWLVTTTKDGSVSLWELNVSVNSSGTLQLSTSSRLLSLGDCHVSSATSCCWHPERRILATGGLDCRVFLWMLPKSTMELELTQSTSKRSKVPFRCLRTGSGRVSSVAFRLPDQSSVNYETDAGVLDVLAVGCWDGTVRIHDLETLKMIKLLRTSNWAVSSMDFSPNGGSLFVTRDTKGRVCMWKSKSYTLLSVIEHADSFSSMCTLDPRFPEVAQCNPGRVCFSRPRGRYLIQSGCEYNFDTGRMIVWSSQLGATLGPWRSTENLLSAPEQVTTFTVDPFGHIAIVGSNEGRLTFVCSRTSRVLPTNLTHQTAVRAQCVSCHIVDANSQRTEYTLLVAAGFSSGFVKIFSCQISNSILGSHTSTNSGSHCDCRVQSLKLLNKHGYHSEDTRDDSVAFSGGTLSICAANRVVASGGGNASCAVNFYVNKEVEGLSHLSVTNIDGLHSAVTAVDASESLVIVGTKSRLVIVFSLDHEHLTVARLTEIPHAANDWITALALSWPRDCKQQEKADRHPTVIVGSHDHAIRVYRIEDGSNNRLASVFNGPGGSITCLSSNGRFLAAGSAEGLVKVWKLETSNRLEEVTSMDLTSASSTQFSAGQMCVSYLRLFIETTVHPQGTESCQPPVDQSLDESPPEPDVDELADSVEPMDEEEIVSSKSRPQIPQQSCLFTLSKPNDVVRMDARDAPYLRMMVGQHFPLSSDSRNPVDGFRFRLFAPLLPECRAVLRGHLGAAATSLATGVHTDWNDDSLLVSVAGPANNFGSGNGDVRIWRLPTDDSCHNLDPIQHQGPVACLCPLTWTESDSFCLSGGLDGAVVFWRLSANDTSGHPCSSYSTSIKWKSVAKVQVCTTQPIIPVTAVCTFVCESSRFIVMANGKSLSLLGLQQRAVENLEKSGVLTFDNLLATANLKTLGIDMVKKLALENCLVDLCLLNRSGSNNPVILMAYANGSFSILQFTESSDKPGIKTIGTKVSFFEFQPPLPRECVGLPYSLNMAGTSVVGAHRTAAFMLTSAGEKMTIKKLFQSGDLKSDELLKFILPMLLPEVGDPSMYLVTTVVGNISRLKILDPEGSTVAQTEAFVNPRSITASYCHQDPANPGYFFIVMATSDGLLHVYYFHPKKHEKGGELVQLRKVALYPTGERITKLMLLVKGQPQLQVIAGCQSGHVNIYTIG